jgi:hypothetical protein
LNALLVPVLLLITVVASVSLGVLATYASVFCILHGFGRASRPEPVREQPRLVLVAAQNPASGD